MVPCWVFYEQEPVHAEPNHKQDGGVKVDVQNIAIDEANVDVGFLEVIGIKVGEAWQRAEKNEVRDSQVEQVNVTTLPLLQAKKVTQNNQKVARKTDAELESINR